jgi:hypothetical protein
MLHASANTSAGAGPHLNTSHQGNKPTGMTEQKRIGKRRSGAKRRDCKYQRRLATTRKDPTLRALFDALRWSEMWDYLLGLEERDHRTLGGGELRRKLGVTHDPATRLSWQHDIVRSVVGYNAEGRLLQGLKFVQEHRHQDALIENYLCFALGAIKRAGRWS